MKASELFRKYPKTSDFDHSNYRLFERIPAVPGTSKNRGLTVDHQTRCDGPYLRIEIEIFSLHWMMQSIIHNTELRDFLFTVYLKTIVYEP